jgi:predicted transcriptional regulator
MHTITLKSDDNFYETLNEMVKSLKTTKSELIRRAVMHYRDVLEKEKLKSQIKEASYKVRKESLQITKEFENSIDDGI